MDKIMKYPDSLIYPPLYLAWPQYIHHLLNCFMFKPNTVLIML